MLYIKMLLLASSDNVLNTPRPSANTTTTTAPAAKPTQTNVYTSSNVDFDSGNFFFLFFSLYSYFL